LLMPGFLRIIQEIVPVRRVVVRDGSWGRTPAPLFKQGRQPLIPFREFDADRALQMILR